MMLPSSLRRESSSRPRPFTQPPTTASRFYAGPCMRMPFLGGQVAPFFEKGASPLCGGGIICGVRLRRRPTYAFSVEPPDGSIEDRGERNPRQVGEEQHGSQTA